VDESFFKFGALARRVGDRDLNEAAFPGVTEDSVDALAGHLQPLRDRVLGLTFPEIVPADFGHQSGVGSTIAGFAFV
jgi:hypothetical protein